MKTFIKIHPVNDMTDVLHYKNLKNLCDKYKKFSYLYLQKKDIKKGFTYKGYWIEKIEVVL